MAKKEEKSSSQFALFAIIAMVLVVILQVSDLLKNEKEILKTIKAATQPATAPKP